MTMSQPRSGLCCRLYNLALLVMGTRRHDGEIERGMQS
jgi:hypothetical protein